jgi:hypothetical protein
VRSTPSHHTAQNAESRDSSRFSTRLADCAEKSRSDLRSSPALARHGRVRRCRSAHAERHEYEEYGQSPKGWPSFPYPRRHKAPTPRRGHRTSAYFAAKPAKANTHRATTVLLPKDGRLDVCDPIGRAAITQTDRRGRRGLRISLGSDTTPSVDFLTLMCDDPAIRTQQLCGVEPGPIPRGPEIYGALVGRTNPSTRTRGSKRGVKPTPKRRRQTRFSGLPTIGRQSILICPSVGCVHRSARSHGSDNTPKAHNHEASGQSHRRHVTFQSIPRHLSISDADRSGSVRVLPGTRRQQQGCPDCLDLSTRWVLSMTGGYSSTFTNGAVGG